MAGQTPGSEPSVVALVRDAVRDFTLIVKGEIALAQIQLKQAAANGAVGAVLIMFVVSLLTMVSLFASVSLALGFAALGLAMWLSFLLVSVLYLLFALILAFVAIRFFQRVKGPEAAKRVAVETKVYLQAALMPPKPADEATDTAPDAAATTTGAATTPSSTTPAQPAAAPAPRSVTLPARLPDASGTTNPDPGAAPKA